ncbi:MAG: sodium-dependent transporter [Bacteroidetes bacterium]|nr:sodium-dependent transporter [Bacteroidota bacterium]
MATSSSTTRGTWNSKLGFILAAAGSAVGLGNIWAFPTKVATEGGAAYLLIYLLCTFAIGFPVMAAEITIGRSAGKNPVGAFKAISTNKFFPLVGIWGVICGVMILSFYTVIAGWAFGFAFEEIFYFFGWADAANWLTNTGNGFKNALIASVFMFATIRIITGGVSDGIERATKAMMPLLIGIIIVMIVYVLWQPGSNAGIEAYLLPDFSRINAELIFSAMGQAFFSLSLGMGALITYGSYLSKRENIPQAAAFVTLADVGIAFLAGLLIVPAMFLAQSQGISIDAGGSLASSTDLVFQILPALFHTIGGGVGMILGVTFFLLLSIAALTSTISLLEVPVSYVIDEFEVKRKKAAWSVGLGILVISVVVAYFPVLIGWFDYLFSSIGLPLGGFLICIFVGYFWTTDKAITEMESGYAGVRKSLFAKVWPIFIKYICPAAILYNLISNFV